MCPAQAGVYLMPRSRFICCSISSTSSLIFLAPSSAVARARCARSSASCDCRSASARAAPDLS